jgi:hypothetical protein
LSTNLYLRRCARLHELQSPLLTSEPRKQRNRSNMFIMSLLVIGDLFLQSCVGLIKVSEFGPQIIGDFDSQLF